MSALDQWNVGLAIAIAAILICMAAAGIELAARYFLRKRIGYRLCLPWQRLVLEPAKGISPHLPSRAASRYNSFGQRGEELQEHKGPVIWAVGGSSTEGALLDQGQDWPSRLEVRLRQREISGFPSGPDVRVVNMGRSLHDSAASLRALRGYWDMGLRPACVLHAPAFSDVVRWIQAGTPAEAWVPELSDDEVFAIHPTRSFAWNRRQSAARLVYELMLFRLSNHEVVHQKAGRYMLKCQQERAKGNWVEVPSLPEAVIQRTLDNIASIHTLCREAGVKYVVTLLPWNESDQFNTEEERRLWFGRWKIDDTANPEPWRFVRTKDLFDGFRVINMRLLDFCRSNGIQCLPLRGKVPADFHHFYDEAHITPLGAEALAEVLFDEILRNEHRA